MTEPVNRVEAALAPKSDRWDSHDHASRDRMTYQFDDFGRDKGDKQALEWSAVFHSRAASRVRRESWEVIGDPVGLG